MNIKTGLSNVRSFFNPKSLIGDLKERVAAQGIRLKNLQLLYEQESDWKHRYANTLQALTEAMQAMVWQKDSQHRYMLANSIHCFKFFGFIGDTDCLQRVLGKTDLELVTELYTTRGVGNSFAELCAYTDDYTRDSQEIGHFIEGGKINGEPLLLYVIKNPEYDSHGNFLGTLGMGWDFTPQSEFMVTILNRWIYDGMVTKVYKSHDVFAYALEPTLRKCDIFHHICPNPQRGKSYGDVNCSECKDEEVRTNE